MNWSAFWGTILGTAVPSLIVSILMLYFNSRFNRALEQNKKELEERLVKFSKLHDKRLEAMMVVVYHAFCDYLDFLRVALCVPHVGMNMDPMHLFRRTLERQIIYLDDATEEKVGQYQGELLCFWNWAMSRLAEQGESAREEIQKRLDFEIPGYLPKLRKDFNAVLGGASQ